MRAYTRKYRQRIRFNMSPNRVFAFGDVQNGLCAICKTPWAEIPPWTPVKNKAGAVVGIVCAKCGRGINNFEGDPVLLERAKILLETPPPDEYPWRPRTLEDIIPDDAINNIE
jgi:hypothetical protein